MSSIPPRTSLCSYTYNDAVLLHGLLESVRAWSLRPDEIVLLDDGSAEPFSLTETEKELPVKLLRHERNLGFTRTKHDCISAAAGDIILAMDCDARASSDFLALCTRLLQDRSIGLLSPQTSPPVSDDYTSWYSYTFSFGRVIAPAEDSEFALAEKPAQTDVTAELPLMDDAPFIGGGVFALRREVWQEVGGFSGYEKNVHEDSYLSNIVLAHGYSLKVAHRPLRLLRVLSREALCRRYWYLGRSSGCVEAVVNSGKSLPLTQAGFIDAVRSRCASIEKNELTHVFYYYEILIMLHTLLEFCNAIGSQGRLPKQAGNDLLAGVQRRLAACPKLWLLLKADLLKLRVLPLPEYPGPQPGDGSDLARVCDWTEAWSVFEDLQSKNILAYLENKGVALLMQDERETETHFSGY